MRKKSFIFLLLMGALSLSAGLVRAEMLNRESLKQPEGVRQQKAAPTNKDFLTIYREKQNQEYREKKKDVQSLRQTCRTDIEITKKQKQAQRKQRVMQHQSDLQSLTQKYREETQELSTQQKQNPEKTNGQQAFLDLQKRRKTEISAINEKYKQDLRSDEESAQADITAKKKSCGEQEMHVLGISTDPSITGQ